MAYEAKPCQNIEGVFDPIPPNNGDKNYRYFTLPIEQIPGFIANQPQILVHRPNCGLQWFSLDKCLPVVTCLDLTEDALKVERRSIVVIKDFEIQNESEKDDCDIPVTSCESITP